MNPSNRELQTRSARPPAEFFHDADVAECALDEQLEQLHRHYATASRAASRAQFELELLEARDDLHAHVLAQVRSRRAAADTRCARLMRAIDALEERLERAEIE